MDDLILRLPRVDEADEFLRACRATSPEVPSFLHFYEPGVSLAVYLEVLTRLRSGTGLPAGIVPETLLFAFAGARIVGRVAIRHRLSARLEREGGHIGYVVVPEFRRRGYGTRLLTLALRIAGDELGIDPVLVTCDDDNAASIRVIERNGGVLQDVLAADGRDARIRRYWIRRRHAGGSSR
jgi:predicted acetyltransferase